MAIIDKLEAIGDAIRNKTGKTALLTLADMPSEIESIETGGSGEGIPEEAFLITDNCGYRFSNDGWNWFFNKYGNKITTKDITNADHMFFSSSISEIPFDINIKNGTNARCDYIFSSTNITKVPYINGGIEQMQNCFYMCYSLTEIPEDWASHIDWDRLHTYSNTGCNNIFSYCTALKHIPTSLLNELWSLGTGTTSTPYNYMFNYCYVLSEANGIAIHKATLTSNRCTNMTTNCLRLKSFTFVTQPDGTPYTANWKSQTIDMQPCGWGNSYPIITGNSGITADKEVKDDETYQALKNDPDWFTANVAYSRYNHDSAVETINSLPDTSAYGTNTIKFNGSAGSLTDGGAINTLTEAEIAVATAKGWTVTLT